MEHLIDTRTLDVSGMLSYCYLSCVETGMRYVELYNSISVLFQENQQEVQVYDFQQHTKYVLAHSTPLH